MRNATAARRSLLTFFGHFSVYRGQVIMNTAEVLFFPTLTVGQMMDFATRMKVPFRLPSSLQTAQEYQQASRVLKCMDPYPYQTPGLF